MTIYSPCLILAHAIRSWDVVEGDCTHKDSSVKQSSQAEFVENCQEDCVLSEP